MVADMRELKPFGKRQSNGKTLPKDKVLKDTFGIVNEGCDSMQVVDFIRRTTGHTIKEIKEK